MKGKCTMINYQNWLNQGIFNYEITLIIRKMNQITKGTTSAWVMDQSSSLKTGSNGTLVARQGSIKTSGGVKAVSKWSKQTISSIAKFSGTYFVGCLEANATLQKWIHSYSLFYRHTFKLYLTLLHEQKIFSFSFKVMLHIFRPSLQHKNYIWMLEHPITPEEAAYESLILIYRQQGLQARCF